MAFSMFAAVLHALAQNPDESY